MVNTLTDEEYLSVMGSILLTEPLRGYNPHEPARVMDGVYLGSQRNAESWKLLERLNITHVLNCAAYKGPRTYLGSPYDGLNIDYHEFPADDTDHYDITRHFAESFRFIDKARQRGGNVLVHCAQGINRSGAICLAYFMERCNQTILRATRSIKSKRRIFLSNPGFQKLLVRFARRKGLLETSGDEIFMAYNISSPKSIKQRSQSVCNRSGRNRTLEREIIWPDDRVSIINGGIDKLIINNAYPCLEDTIRHYRFTGPEITLRPLSRHLGSSLSRFDFY